MELLLGFGGLWLLGLSAVLYSVRHSVGHHSHPHDHPHSHDYAAPVHLHPTLSFRDHTHPYSPFDHEHQHEHPHEHDVVNPLGHVHFWVRDGENYIGARGKLAATYRCDVPDCPAKCVHEWGVA